MVFNYLFLFLYLALFSYQYFPTFFLFKRVVYYFIGKIFLPKSYLCETIYRSSRPDVFLGKSVLKICSNFTGEHPCRSVISIKLQSNFIEIALRHECSPVNLLHIFRTRFPKNTSGSLLLYLPEGNFVTVYSVTFRLVIILNILYRIPCPNKC